MDAMKAAGMGGFFMHARAGLKTPYLRKQWFDCVRFCVEKAERLGMKAWIYDEDGWPSGFAGGDVPRQGREYRAKALVMEFAPRPEDDEYLLLAEYKASSAEEQDGYFYEWTQPLGQERFADASYVDLLNADVTQAFLESTHQKYAEATGVFFGSTIPGVFSDEACALMRLDPTRPALPWTGGLAAAFQAKCGYGLLPSLPSLSYPWGDYRQVRYDYWSLVAELFADNFNKMIHDWCERRGLAYTGHLMAEDRLVYQMEWVGDVMRQYEYMHIPGMDHLGRQIHKSEMEFSQEPFTTVLTAKQVTSVAHQLGKKRALSELYACAGQGFDIALQKWMTDWHLVHGINLFNPHLFPYAFVGESKRDYPPTIGAQQPWWSEYKLLTDYQARMSYALTLGRRVTHVLVLHPMESVFEAYSPLEKAEAGRINEELERLSLSLLDAHIDFDYGNEHLLERYGEASNGTLAIGSCRYKLVIVPPCSRLRASTVRMLREFAQAGGILLSVATPQELGNAIKAWTPMPVHPFSIRQVRAFLPDSVRIDGELASHIWVHEREEAAEEGNEVVRGKQAGKIYFFANLSLNRRVQVTLKLPGHVAPVSWDAESGEVRAIDCRRYAGRTEIAWRFEPGQSLLLEAREDASLVHPALSGHLQGTVESVVDYSITYTQSPLDPNALLIDKFALCSADTGEWGEPLPVAAWKKRKWQQAVRHRYRAEFTLERDFPAIPVYVALEEELHAEVRCNETALRRVDRLWLDPGFIVYELPPECRSDGRNTIELALSEQGFGVLENIYVIGDFALRTKAEGEYVLSAQNGLDERTADAAINGFPFYAGKFRLVARIDLAHARIGAERLSAGAGKRQERLLLRLSEPAVSTAVLFVNGVHCGAKAWGPWEWDITDQPAGSCQIELIIGNSLRNLIGPHHYYEDERLNFLTPAHFFDQEYGTNEAIVTPFHPGKLLLVKVSIEQTAARKKKD